jgi:hypothetical protein
MKLKKTRPKRSIYKSDFIRISFESEKLKHQPNLTKTLVLKNLSNEADSDFVASANLTQTLKLLPLKRPLSKCDINQITLAEEGQIKTENQTTS